MTEYEKYFDETDEQFYCPNCGKPIVADITEPCGGTVKSENGYCILNDRVYIHKESDTE